MSGLLLGHFPEIASKLGTQEQNKELAWGAGEKKDASPRWYHGCGVLGQLLQISTGRDVVLCSSLGGGAHESDVMDAIPVLQAEGGHWPGCK